MNMITFEQYWDGLPYGERRRLALRLSRHPVYLQAVAHHRKRPSFALAQDVERETDGAVSLASWGKISEWIRKNP